MFKHSENTLARVSQQLSHLEKRDWELWVIVSLAGVLVSVGLLVVFIPAAFKGNTIHFEVNISWPLGIGLLLLLALLNTYLVTKRFEMRRLREQFISSALEHQLTEQQSFIDPLTDVYNRRSLERIAGQFINQARRQRTPLTFLMVDADRFKDINTRFGHLAGDFVLAEIAAILKSSIRGSDAAVRYGGDEFLLLLGDTTLLGSQKVVDRINGKLEEWNDTDHLEGLRVNLSLSIGAAEWDEGKSLDEVLGEADHRMYDRKSSILVP